MLLQHLFFAGLRWQYSYNECGCHINDYLIDTYRVFPGIFWSKQVNEMPFIARVIAPLGWGHHLNEIR